MFQVVVFLAFFKTYFCCLHDHCILLLTFSYCLLCHTFLQIYNIALLNKAHPIINIKLHIMSLIFSKDFNPIILFSILMKAKDISFIKMQNTKIIEFQPLQNFFFNVGISCLIYAYIRLHFTLLFLSFLESMKHRNIYFLIICLDSEWIFMNTIFFFIRKEKKYVQ